MNYRRKKDLRLPCDLIFGYKLGDNGVDVDFVANIHQKMDYVVNKKVRYNIQTACDCLKLTYCVKPSHSEYQLENVVRMHNPQKGLGLSSKLQTSWKEPYEAANKINDVMHRIKNASSDTHIHSVQQTRSVCW